jgi:hypothetical protein
MRTTRLVLLVAAVGAAGCAPNLCERATKASNAVAGDCGEAASPLLGMSCSANLPACSDADVQLLTAAVACVEKLPTCSSIAKDAWQLQESTCTDPLAALSQGCLDAFFMGKPPNFDAGEPDAGPQAINDGGSALGLYGAVNETTVALGWTPKQGGAVTKWMLVETDTLGDGRTETEFGDGATLTLTIDDAGTRGRRYFVVGLDSSGAVVTGMPLSGGMDPDAGIECRSGNDCATDKVCDLGQCRTQTCQFTMANTCPLAYQCFSPGVCQRTGDAGVVGGGGTTDGGERPLPFSSNAVSLLPGPAKPSPLYEVGQVAGKRPAIVGIDTARVMLGLEQEGQLISHPSSARGTDYPIDALTSTGLDTVGTRLHLAWNAESRALYACYVVGRGVRVQKSVDLGRTWGVSAVTFEPPAVDDGGVSEIIRDCDIAPWRNGGALLVTSETEALVVRHLSATLTEEFKGPAFTSDFADGGADAIFFPSHPSVATLPASQVVHITFTGNRYVTGSVVDTEPYGIFREGSGSFSPALRLTGVLPSATPEDWTTVAIHPKTGRALAAFTTVQAGTTQFSTNYISIFSPTARIWATGAHLNTFLVDQNTSVVLPEKAPTDLWYAFSPQLAPLPDGTFAYSFVAGPRSGSPATGDYRQYLVPFDLERTAQTVPGKGWYVLPVTKVSEQRVLDPRGGLSAPQPPVSALAADSQISVYGVFIPGTGSAGDVEGPARFFSYP